MKILAFATTFALIASQAASLSCMRPDPIETFQRLAASPDSYFAIMGTLTFDEAALPTGSNDVESATAPDPIAGFFDGTGLSKGGFVTPYVADVMLQVTCAGPWCGSARSGERALYFVPASDRPVALQAGPCGGMIFPDPSEEILEMLTSCMQSGTCEPLIFE